MKRKKIWLYVYFHIFTHSHILNFFCLVDQHAVGGADEGWQHFPHQNLHPGHRVGLQDGRTQVSGRISHHKKVDMTDCNDIY